MRTVLSAFFASCFFFPLVNTLTVAEERVEASVGRGTLSLHEAHIPFAQRVRGIPEKYRGREGVREGGS